MALLSANHMRRYEAFLTEKVIFTKKTLSCSSFLVALNANPLAMVVVLSNGLRLSFISLLWDKHLEWIKQLLAKLPRRLAERLVML